MQRGTRSGAPADVNISENGILLGISPIRALGITLVHSRTGIGFARAGPHFQTLLASELLGPD